MQQAFEGFDKLSIERDHHFLVWWYDQLRRQLQSEDQPTDVWATPPERPFFRE